MQDLLKYVDVLIGLSLVMLLASTVIAALTQVFTSGTFARARFLRRGLSRLIEQLHPDLQRATQPGQPASIADVLADAVLRHPMIGHEGTALARVSSAKMMGAINQATKEMVPGTVVEREELIRILLEIAANEGPLCDKVDSNIRTALANALGQNGVLDAAGTLREIRAKRIEMELEQPQLAQAVWHARAIMTSTACDFVGKVNSWFDHTMDRVTQRFAAEARTITTVVALVFVVAIQLDIRDLVVRLWSDDALRNELVRESESYQKRIDDRQQAADAGNTKALSQAEEDQARLNAVRQSLTDMRTPSLQLIPENLVWEGVAQTSITASGVGSSPQVRLVIDDLNWPFRVSGDAANPLAAIRAQLEKLRTRVRIDDVGTDRLRLVARDQNINSIRLEAEKSPGTWVQLSGDTSRVFDWGAIGFHFWGVLFAWILVSLGAPFWYDALKNLLKFRSVVAQKEAKNRQERDATQVPVPVPARSASNKRKVAQDEEEVDVKATGAAG